MADRNIFILRESVWAWTGSTDKRLPRVAIDHIVNGVIADIVRRADVSECEKQAEITFGYTGTTGLADGTPWPATATEDAGIAVSAVNVAALPSNFSRPHAMWIVSNSEPVYLNQLAFDAFRDKHKTVSQGDPKDYALWDGAVYVAPRPAYGGSVYMYYYAEPEELGSDLEAGEVTSSEILTKYWDLILDGSIAEAYKYLFEEQRYPVFAAGYEKRIRRLLIQESRRNHTGRVLFSEIP